jgi:hypothetical protein
VRSVLFSVSTPDARGYRKYNLRGSFYHQCARLLSTDRPIGLRCLSSAVPWTLGNGNCGNKQHNSGAVEDETCFHDRPLLQPASFQPVTRERQVRSFHRGAAGPVTTAPVHAGRDATVNTTSMSLDTTNVLAAETAPKARPKSRPSSPAPHPQWSQ